MKCEEFLRRLDAGESLDEPEARSHRESCADCRRAFERDRAVRGEFAAMGAEPAPPFLHARVMAAVREAAREPARQRFSVLRLAWAGPLLVLAFAVVLGGYGLWRALAPPGAPSALPRQAAPTLKEEVTVQPAVTPPAMEVEHAPPVKGGPAAEKAAPHPPPAGLRRETQAATATKPALPLARKETARGFAPEPEGGELGGVLGGVPSEEIGKRVKTGAARAADEATETEGRLGGPVPSAPASATTQALRLGAAPVKPTGARAPVRFLAPPVVPCVIRPASGAEGTVVGIPVSAAPPPGAAWHVLVSQKGEASVDELGDRTDPVATAARASIKALGLAPGRYLLERGAR